MFVSQTYPAQDVREKTFSLAQELREMSKCKKKVHAVFFPLHHPSRCHSKFSSVGKTYLDHEDRHRHTLRRSHPFHLKHRLKSHRVADKYFLLLASRMSLTWHQKHYMYHKKNVSNTFKTFLKCLHTQQQGKVMQSYFVLFTL